MKIQRNLDLLEIYLKQGLMSLAVIVLCPIVLIGYVAERIKRLGN